MPHNKTGSPGSSNFFSFCSLGLIGVVGLSGLMLLPLLVGSYVDSLGYSEEVAGQLSSINLGGITVMTLLMSFKVKHWPLERIAGLGLITMIVFDGLSLVFDSLYLFAAMRFLSGAAGGAVQSAVAAAIARTSHPDRGYGIYIGLQFLLPSIAFYVLPNFFPGLGYHGLIKVLIGLEVASLLLIPLMAAYVLPPMADAGKRPGHNQEWRIMLAPAALLSLAGLCIYGAANSAIYAYSERVGITAGLSWADTGSALSLANLLAVLGALAVVVLGDRFGHLKPMLAGIAVQALTMVLLIVYPGATSYWINIVLWSIAWAFTWPYFLSMQADLDNSGTVVVGGQFTNLLGNSLGPAMAATLLLDGDYSGVLYLSGALFLLSILPMYFVNRHLPGHSRGS